jgi:hypothetical protein
MRGYDVNCSPGVSKLLNNTGNRQALFFFFFSGLGVVTSWPEGPLSAEWGVRNETNAIPGRKSEIPNP